MVADMQISSINNMSYKKTSFGLDISEDLYKPMDKLLNQVFTVDAYMRKRRRRVIPYKPSTTIGVKQRLRTALGAIDIAMPHSTEKIYPYIDDKGKAFIALDTPKKRILLGQISKDRINKAGDFDSLRIKLFDLEMVAYKLYEMGKRQKIIDGVKKVLRFLGIK